MASQTTSLSLMTRRIRSCSNGLPPTPVSATVANQNASIKLEDRESSRGVDHVEGYCSSNDWLIYNELVGLAIARYRGGAFRHPCDNPPRHYFGRTGFTIWYLCRRGRLFRSVCRDRRLESSRGSMASPAGGLHRN